MILLVKLLEDNNQADVIVTFNSTSRYLHALIQMVGTGGVDSPEKSQAILVSIGINNWTPP